MELLFWNYKFHQIIKFVSPQKKSIKTHPEFVLRPTILSRQNNIFCDSSAEKIYTVKAA